MATSSTAATSASGMNVPPNAPKYPSPSGGSPGNAGRKTLLVIAHALLARDTPGFRWLVREAAGKGGLSKPRRPGWGDERRDRGERSRSDTSYGTPDAEPSHPVHLTSLGTKHVPHLAPQHTPRRGPAAARPAPRGEVDSDGHSRMLPRGQKDRTPRTE